jgi:hypothetical protein
MVPQHVVMGSNESEFLSPYGVRALSAAHREHPFSVNLGGMTYTVDYAPG